MFKPNNTMKKYVSLPIAAVVEHVINELETCVRFPAAVTVMVYSVSGNKSVKEVDVSPTDFVTDVGVTRLSSEVNSS